MDALEIGLRSLGLQPGEKVLTTPLSAFATTLAIIRARGVPVFVDVDELGLIDLEQCRQLLQKDRSIRFFVPRPSLWFPSRHA
jgi:dTDP-3-amino-3,4,6-trideoxy-alpha-D-glucose transaminase